MSHFIVVEGLDATGKTTLCRKLCESLDCEYLYSVPDEYTRFRESILIPNSGKESRFLYYLSGVLAQREKIRLILNQNKDVVMDRFIYSTIAYHSAYGVNTDCLDLSKLNIIWPTKTILLTTETDIRKMRLLSRKDLHDHEINAQFQQNANRKLLELINELRLDTTTNSIKKVHDLAMQYICDP